MAFLEITIGDQTTKAQLDDFAASLGRGPENSIVVNDPDVSRRHCIIERYEKGYRVHDLGSRNGTKLNGERVAREPLKNDDIIRIGGAEIRFVEEKPQRAPMGARLRSRAAMWCLGVLGVTIAVLLLAWGGGWLGGSLDTDALKAKLEGLVDDESPDADSTIDDVSGDDPTTLDGVTTKPHESTTTHPVIETTNRSGDDWVEAYKLLTAETLQAHAANDLMRPVRAIFLGNPLKGDGQELLWDLPPNGELIALIEPGNAAYDALVKEPVMVEAECCGVLKRKEGEKSLFLMVGEMRIIGAWVGSDDQLQPATRQLLGKRIVVNPIFTAEKVQAPE